MLKRRNTQLAGEVKLWKSQAEGQPSSELAQQLSELQLKYEVLAKEHEELLEIANLS